MEELWVNVVGYEGFYEVSNRGGVRSTKRKFAGKGKVLEPAVTRGYLRVALSVAGKARQYSVHRLVAEAFIPCDDTSLQVNHKDGNKLNNAVENLEWVTPKENIRHSFECGLSKHTGGNHYKAVQALLVSPFGDIFYTDCITSFSNVTGLNRRAMSRVISGERKQHRGWTKYVP